MSARGHGTGAFPPIDPDHPLTQAARETNAHAERNGLEATLEWLNVGTGVGEVSYLAEQRALRAIAATAGIVIGDSPALDEAAMRAIVKTPLWRDMAPLLLGCYLDAIAIGWRGRELHDKARAE